MHHACTPFACPQLPGDPPTFPSRHKTFSPFALASTHPDVADSYYSPGVRGLGSPVLVSYYKTRAPRGVGARRIWQRDAMSRTPLYAAVRSHTPYTEARLPTESADGGGSAFYAAAPTNAAPIALPPQIPAYGEHSCLCGIAQGLTQMRTRGAPSDQTRIRFTQH